MDENIKKRYQMLKQRNEQIVKEQKWKKNDLFVECITALCEVDVLSLNKTEETFKRMEKNFSMTCYGHIDWEKFKNIKTIDDVWPIMDKSSECYILWDNEDIPCVSCKWSAIVKNIEEVLAVSFNTWILSGNETEIIEFYHEGTISYGKICDM